MEYSGKLIRPDFPLASIASEIHRRTNKVKQDWLALGEMFTAARARFPGDREFGAWCTDNGFEIPARTRAALMTVYRRFGSQQPAAVGWSVLLELANVPDAELAIEADVTKSEAREIAKAGSFEQWREIKEQARIDAAASISTPDAALAPGRASAAAAAILAASMVAGATETQREAPDTTLAKQQDPARIEKAKAKVSPDSAYHKNAEPTPMEVIHARAQAENAIIGQVDKAIAAINRVLRPDMCKYASDESLAEAWNAWQKVLLPYINAT